MICACALRNAWLRMYSPCVSAASLGLIVRFGMGTINASALMRENKVREKGSNEYASTQLVYTWLRIRIHLQYTVTTFRPTTDGSAPNGPAYKYHWKFFCSSRCSGTQMVENCVLKATDNGLKMSNPAQFIATSTMKQDCEGALIWNRPLRETVLDLYLADDLRDKAICMIIYYSK